MSESEGTRCYHSSISADLEEQEIWKYSDEQGTSGVLDGYSPSCSCVEDHPYYDRPLVSGCLLNSVL